MSEFRLPSGEWRCTRDNVTEPCGDCDGCREVQGPNRLLSLSHHLGYVARRADRIGTALKAAADE